MVALTGVVLQGSDRGKDPPPERQSQEREGDPYAYHKRRKGRIKVVFDSYYASRDHWGHGGLEDGDLYHRSPGAKDHDEQQCNDGRSEKKLVEKSYRQWADVISYLVEPELETHPPMPGMGEASSQRL